MRVMPMAGWSYCPYEQNFHCKRIKRDCDPGVPGCILYGRIERDDLAYKPPVPLQRRPGKKRPGAEE
jgi:hypothetical protein